MTINRKTVDHAALPALLLPQMKEHLRVRHDRDDGLITTYIASAIGLIERKCNVSLDPATVIATADELRRCGYLALGGQSYLLPLNNVRSALVTDATATDLSDDFEVWNPDFGGNGSSFLVDRTSGWLIGAGWLLELEVGVDDATKLAPAFFALIGRMTGSLYENREASSALFEDTWASELMGLWRPCA